ncbi:hypothetical protein [Vibrio pacinii]|uniref:hypothetical protein n=1 Tax=Vibrio pacinii TaxID=170674 RepID=UPI00056EC013
MVRFLVVTFSMIVALAVQAKQDPTAPLGWSAPATNGIKSVNKVAPLPKLQSIVCPQSGDCSAILNGQPMVIGERVSGYTVRHIEPELVTLARGGKTWKLQLFSLEVKQ